MLPSATLSCEYFTTYSFQRWLIIHATVTMSSRDVRWLNTTFLEYMKSQNEENDNLEVASSDDDDDDDDDDDNNVSDEPDEYDDDNDADDNDDDDDTQGTVCARPRTQSGRYVPADSIAPLAMTAMATRELRRLGGTWFNPAVDRILDDADAQEAAVDA